MQEDQEEIKCIQRQQDIPKGSPLKNLDPFQGICGLLRVGRRIGESSFSQAEKSPLIIPGQHHVVALIVKHYHEQTYLLGCLFTEEAVRMAELWIVCGRKKVSSIIHQCVTWRLRALLNVQKMTSLPADRLSTEPPFTDVKLDVFGPWSVSS